MGDDLRKREGVDLGPRREAPAGRLGTFAVLGALAGGVPLPWLPDAVERRIRGALVQDVAARHGLSVTPDARAVLCEPAGPDGPRGLLGQARRFLAGRALMRFGRLGMLPPVRGWLRTYVLGHLFTRYLDTARAERAVRIDVEEARRVRRAIDKALVHAVTGELDQEREHIELPPEDLRDDVTQLSDALLIAVAGMPSWLVRRLDAAFDDILAQDHG